MKDNNTLPVSFPDFRQLRLFSERVRIVRTVFDGVGLKWVTSWDLRCCCHLSPPSPCVRCCCRWGRRRRIGRGRPPCRPCPSAHARCTRPQTHCCSVKSKIEWRVHEQHLSSDMNSIWYNFNSMNLPCKTHNRLEVFWSSLSFSCWRMIWKLGVHSRTCWEAALRLGSLNS